MAFEDGNELGVGLSKNGTKRSSLLIREYLNKKNINLIEQILARVVQVKDPKEAAELLIKIMPYAYPRLANVTIEAKSPEEMALEQMSDIELFKRVKEIVDKKAIESEAIDVSESSDTNKTNEANEKLEEQNERSPTTTKTE